MVWKTISTWALGHSVKQPPNLEGWGSGRREDLCGELILTARAQYDCDPDLHALSFHPEPSALADERFHLLQFYG